MAFAGIALIDKPSEITSFAALGPLKRRLGKGVKVGHTGTLDKFASGLLVVCIGSYTKLASIITGADKSYEATILLGEETDTLDPSGSVIAQAPLPDTKSVERAASRFLGEIEQTPPAYSALHIKGERAYKRILRGEEFEMPSRRVTIKELAIQSIDLPRIEIAVSCSKGTYIRSLARDLAREVDSRGYLSRLRRVSVGPFSVRDAVLPEAFDPHLHILSAAQLLSCLTEVRMEHVTDHDASRIRLGILPPPALTDTLSAGEHLLLFTEAETLIASLRKEGEKVAFDFVVGEKQ